MAVVFVFKSALMGGGGDGEFVADRAIAMRITGIVDDSPARTVSAEMPSESASAAAKFARDVRMDPLETAAVNKATIAFAFASCCEMTDAPVPEGSATDEFAAI